MSGVEGTACPGWGGVEIYLAVYPLNKSFVIAWNSTFSPYLCYHENKTRERRRNYGK